MTCTPVAAAAHMLDMAKSVPYATRGQGRVRGSDVGGRGNQDGPPTTGIRSSVGMGIPATPDVLM